MDFSRKISQSFVTQVTPARMFKALILDSHNICAKLMFSSIKSIELIEGDGGVGTIKDINFFEGSSVKYMKQRIDMIDKEKFICKYSFIEGDVVMDKLELITYEVKFEGYGNGGCVCKISSEFKPKEGTEITEVDIELGKDRAIGMYEVVEAYLLAHPRDGEPGSIEQINFTEGSSYNYAKHWIDEIDEENLVCKYTMIEGDALGNNVESIAYEVRFGAAANSSEGGGCFCQMTSNYQMIGDFEIKEEEIKASKERVLGIYKLVENHLLNNPQVYA
ncbi:hypothetical protein QYF36_024319 [Acer negundo]|nr:hypothetical protein QYF36_024319 [Acer negundo]